MALKFIDKSSGKVVEKPIRNLIINGVERYRLEVRRTDSYKIDSDYSNSLMYAKGKVNLDLNWPKDGRGEIQKGNDWKFPSDIYVFYKEEGFFYKDWDGSYRRYSFGFDYDPAYNYRILEKLSELVTLYCAPYYSKDYYYYLPAGTKFKGWYTTKTGGKKIETIRDIANNTNLFDYKKTNVLPEITLYGHWELPTYTLKICNISRKNTKSSFEYYDEKTKKWIRTSGTVIFKKVLYNTNVHSFINKKIRNPRYITWAYSALDGTSEQQELRAGPQKFLGWTTKKKEMPGDHSATFYGVSFIWRDETLYPIFSNLIILKQSRLSEGSFIYNNRNGISWKYVETVGGHYYLTDCQNKGFFYDKYTDGPPCINKIFEDNNYSGVDNGMYFNDNDELKYYYQYLRPRYTWKLAETDGGVINIDEKGGCHSCTFVYTIKEHRVT